MKIRTGFVTNSSSTNFLISFIDIKNPKYSGFNSLSKLEKAIIPLLSGVIVDIAAEQPLGEMISIQSAGDLARNLNEKWSEYLSDEVSDYAQVISYVNDPMYKTYYLEIAYLDDAIELIESLRENGFAKIHCRR